MEKATKDKDVLEKFKKHQSSLYNKEWVENAAKEGFGDFVKTLQGAVNDKSRITKANRSLQLLYYGAFEHALNTFIRQVFDDQIKEMEFYLDELGKLTATFKETKKGE